MFLEGLDRMYLIHYLCLQEICSLCELWNHKDISDTFYLTFSGFRYIYEGLVDSYVKKCEELEETKNSTTIRYVEKDDKPKFQVIDEGEFKAARKRREEELKHELLVHETLRPSNAGSSQQGNRKINPALLEAFKRGSGVYGYEMDFADEEEISERERAERLRINLAVHQMKEALDQKRPIDYESIKDPKIIIEFNNQVFEQLARENRAQQNILRKTVMELESRNAVDLQSPGELQRLVYMNTRIVENLQLDKLHLSLDYDTKQVNKTFSESEHDLYKAFSEKQKDLVSKVVHIIRRSYEKETRDVQCGTHFTSKDLENLYLSASVVEKVPNTDAKKEIIKVRQELNKAHDIIKDLKDRLEEESKEVHVKNKLIQGLSENINKLKKLDQAYKKASNDEKLNLSIELRGSSNGESVISQLKEELNAKDILLNSRNVELESQKKRNEALMMAIDYARKVASNHGVLRTSSMVDIQVIMKLEKIIADLKEKVAKFEEAQKRENEDESFMLDIGNGMMVKTNVKMKHVATDTKYLNFKNQVGGGNDSEQLNSASRRFSRGELTFKENSPVDLTLSVVNIAKFFPKKPGQASISKLNQASKADLKDTSLKKNTSEKHHPSKDSAASNLGNSAKHLIGGLHSPGNSKSKKLMVYETLGQLSKKMTDDHTRGRPVAPTKDHKARHPNTGNDHIDVGNSQAITLSASDRRTNSNQPMTGTSLRQLEANKDGHQQKAKAGDYQRPVDRGHDVSTDGIRAAKVDERLAIDKGEGDTVEAATKRGDDRQSGGDETGQTGEEREMRMPDTGMVDERPDMSELWAIMRQLPDEQAWVEVRCLVTKAGVQVMDGDLVPPHSGDIKYESDNKKYFIPRDPVDPRTTSQIMATGPGGQKAYHSSISTGTLPAIKESSQKKAGVDLDTEANTTQGTAAVHHNRRLMNGHQRVYVNHAGKHYSSAVTSRRNSFKDSDHHTDRDGDNIGLRKDNLKAVRTDRANSPGVVVPTTLGKYQRGQKGQHSSSVVYSHRRNQSTRVPETSGDEFASLIKSKEQTGNNGNPNDETSNFNHARMNKGDQRYQSMIQGERLSGNEAVYKKNNSMYNPELPDSNAIIHNQAPEDHCHGSSVFSQSHQGVIPTEYQVFVPLKIKELPDHLNILVDNKHEDNDFLFNFYSNASGTNNASITHGKSLEFSAVGHAIQLPSFKTFKAQVKQFVEQHSGCGPTCPHLKRFYERCGLIMKEQLQKNLGSKKPYLLPLVDMSKRISKDQLEKEVILQETQHRKRDEKLRTAVKKPVFI